METNIDLIKRLTELPKEELHYIMGRLTDALEIDEGWDSDYYRGYLEKVIETTEFEADLPGFWPTVVQLGNPDKSFLDLDRRFKAKIEQIDGIRTEKGHVTMSMTQNIYETTLNPDEDYDWVESMMEEDPELHICLLYHVSRRMANAAFEFIRDLGNGHSEYRVEGFFVLPE